MSESKWLPAGWTDPQRRVIIGLLVVLLGYLSIRLYLNQRYVSDPQPLVPDRAADLADRIDPNIADVATLAALPMIGEKRAKTIVSYREDFLRDHPGKQAFQRAEDLDNIKGIGPMIVEQLKPFLLFDAKQSTTQP